MNQVPGVGRVASYSILNPASPNESSDWKLMNIVFPVDSTGLADSPVSAAIRSANSFSPSYTYKKS